MNCLVYLNPFFYTMRNNTYQLKNGRSLIVSESKPNYQLVDGKNITPIQWGDAMHHLQKNR